MNQEINKIRFTRRQFLQAGTFAAAGLAAGCRRYSFNTARNQNPNILFIHTDQQSLDTISSLGCSHVRTPNIDRLVKGGTTFLESHSADPVCCPARSTWYTGRPPVENGVILNEVHIEPHLPDLGQWFNQNGYEAAYIGKWHVPGRDLSKSFHVIGGANNQGEHGDDAVSRAAQGYLLNRNSSQPFFLSVGFLQPHDICYWFFQHPNALDKLPYPQIADELPPLPANFNFDYTEPELLRRFRRHWPGRFSENWNELSWRYYLWSYYRHVEMVDAQIGRILDALEQSRYADNTLVIFGSDHGESRGCHQLISKSNLYEDALKVPLIFYWPGQIPEKNIDRTHLVSGLDLAPTICDYAGVENLPLARGQSLRPILEQRNSTAREFVIASSLIHGRAVRTPKYKFITYKHSLTDLLFDMEADPHETRNLASEPGYDDIIRSHKNLLAEYESRLIPAPVKKYPRYFTTSEKS